MSLLFYPQKSYRHPAPREPEISGIVYEASAILAAKIQKIFENKTLSLKFTHYLIQGSIYHTHATTLWRLGGHRLLP